MPHAPHIAPLAAISALALLAACSGSDEPGNGTTINISGKTDKGESASASAAPNGKVSINVPGFNMDVKLPKIALDAGDVDIGGLTLYPGSKVVSLNVAAGSGEGDGNDKVQIVFDAPTDATTLKGRFKGKMAEEKFTVSETPGGFAGETEDGEPFALDFAAGAQGHTTGTLNITE
ncbi:MAG: hypothetical protein ACREB5_01720 [Sphingomonadaceae bacterium]